MPRRSPRSRRRDGAAARPRPPRWVRRRRLVYWIVGSFVVVGTVAAFAAAVTGERRQNPVRADAFAVIREGVYLELRSAPDNRLVQRLVDLGPPSAPKGNLVDVVMTPDRENVYYVETDGRRYTIARLPTVGGTPQAIAEGTSPAISPNGKKLAFLDKDLKHIVVRDTSTTSERAWKSGSAISLERTNIVEFNLSWAPDSRHLAFPLVSPSEVFVLDTFRAGSLDGAARRLGPRGDPSEEYWTIPHYLPDGRLSVVKTCCDVSGDVQLVVDARTGRTIRRGVRFDAVVDHVRFDRRGKRMLWSTPTGKLFLTQDGKTARLGERYSAIGW